MTPGLEPVGPDAVRSSTLFGRLVLVVDGARRPDWDPARRSPSVARAAASGVFLEGLPQLLFNHQNTTHDVGLGRMVAQDTFAAAVRALLDDLLTPAAAGWVLESVPSGRPLDLARAIYPDATVVMPESPLLEGLVQRSPAGGRGHAQPQDLADRLLLIVGAPRSGTTWLERLLMTHPQAAGIDEAESWLFRAVSGFWRNYEGGGGLSSVTNGPTLAASLRSLSNRLIGPVLERHPGTRWFVEKTPGHVFLLPEIGRVWPDAWVVNLVRDGRDVARSGAEMLHGPRDIRRAAMGWAASIDAADRYGPSLARYRELRYEALLGDPVAVTSEVFEWVGLPVDDGVRAGVRAAAGKWVSRYNTTGPVGSGKWRSLSRAEVRIVLAVAGDALVRKGYVDPSDVAVARREVRRPLGRFAEWRRRRRAVRAQRKRSGDPAGGSTRFTAGMPTAR